MKGAIRDEWFSGILVVSLFLILASLSVRAAGLEDSLAALVAPEMITPEEIQKHYAEGKLRVLVVPGHSNDDPGAVYRGVREEDLNVSLGTYLVELLNQDERIDSYIIRNRDGEYASWFQTYLKEHADDIRSFRREAEARFETETAAQGLSFSSGVRHNFASNKAGLALHGVNKFANDLDIDVVLHVHFNDYPGRPARGVGKYSGFSIYIPDSRFPNARGSRVLGEAIAERLGRFVPTSNFPGEGGGVVEDHELIAIGSNASRKGASLLVEYGYIYEPPLGTADIRDNYLRELAFQTYLGLREYLNVSGGAPHKTTVLPHMWEKPLAPGARGSLDVFALQYALLAEDLYPPIGSSIEACPMSGDYGPCTSRAVAAFQEKYAKEILVPSGIKKGTGRAGTATITVLNRLYGTGR